MATIPPSSPQFEMRHSTSSIVDIPVPRYMAVEHFCKTYRCALSEIEILGINGGQFVDLESTKAKLLIPKALLADS
jgi:hypothetical protein